MSTARWAWRLAGTCAAVVLATGTGLRAEDATPAPTPTPLPTATPTPVPTPHQSPLAAAAAASGAARPAGPIVIDNETLARYAAKGRLTETTTRAGAAGAARPDQTPSGAEGDGSGAPAGEEDPKRQAWRDRYAEQKKVIEAIRTELAQLDLEIADLWNKFYAWDDPAYRDGVIKVRLDECTGRRDELSRRLPVEEAKLPQILDEARRDGAQPGWFRDLG